jgi:hypothetical protein
MGTSFVYLAGDKLVDYGLVYAWHFLRYDMSRTRYQTARLLFAGWRLNVNRGLATL